MKIDSYRFGKMVVDGRDYDADLVLLPSGPRGGWWREQGHELAIADIESVLAEKPEVLVIGTGAYGMMKVPAPVLEEVRKAGIEVVAAKTKEASRIYNERSGACRVAGAFHLTC